MVPKVDAESGNVLFDLWLVSRATTALIDKAVQSSGLDGDEFGVYSVLYGGEGVTPTELAEWMSAPSTTVSSYVKRLEKRGHVQRIANPEDGRSYRLRLTAKGKKVHQAAGKLFNKPLHEINGELGPDLADARRSLDRLHEVIAALNAAAP